MKKKGFTLVELLAAIVILGLLAILVLPNVLDMFKEAKKKSFESEIKEVYRAAQDKWTTSGKDDTKIYARSKNENCKNQLDLSGRKNLDYFIQLDKKGNVIRYYATDGTYQYQYTGVGLKIGEIEEALEVSKVNDENRINITCDTKTGTYYYTSAPHRNNVSAQFLMSNVKMYQTYNESVSQTGNRFFLRYMIDAFKEEEGSSYYCMYESRYNWDSCYYGQVYTQEECNIEAQYRNAEEAQYGYNYSCKETTTAATSGYITDSILGFEKNGNVYYLDRNEGFEANKDKLISLFGASYCSIQCNSSGTAVFDNADGKNITPSKMVADSLDYCTTQYIVCRDTEIGIYYSDSEAFAENLDSNGEFSRWRWNNGGYYYGGGVLDSPADRDYRVIKMGEAGPRPVYGGYACSENEQYSACGDVKGTSYYNFEAQ